MNAYAPLFLTLWSILLVLTPGQATQSTPTTEDPFDAAARAIAEAREQSRARHDALSARVAQLEREVERLSSPPVQIGLNLSEWNDYGTAAHAVNVLATFTGGGPTEAGWGKPDKPWEPLPGLTLTPLGYPTQDAGSFGYAHAYPDGIYSFRMEGSGDVTFGGKGRNVPGSFRRENGTLTGRVEFRQSRGGVLTIKVTHIDPADPPRDARLVIPGLPADTDQLYTPWFLDKLRPLAGLSTLSLSKGTLRFMQWARTNGSPHVKWSDRKRPNEWTQTGHRGVSYEHMVRLANDLQSDVWLCLPHAADDEYVRETARLFRDNLHPTATV